MSNLCTLVYPSQVMSNQKYSQKYRFIYYPNKDRGEVSGFSGKLLSILLGFFMLVNEQNFMNLVSLRDSFTGKQHYIRCF